MKSKYFAAGLIGFLAIVGWNVFLIQRDQKLYEAYNQPTPKERYCQHQTGWNLNCK